MDLRAAILSACLAFLATPDSEAAPKIGQRTSDCKNWDCSGGIICSCCFSNGCWICDAKSDGTPNSDYGTRYCHWEDAVRNQGIAPGTTAPGGGVLDPGSGGTVMPKLQQLPRIEGTTQ
jgi:hypothetical protein